MTRPPLAEVCARRVWTAALALLLAGCATSSPSPSASGSGQAPETFDLASFGWWVADQQFGEGEFVEGYRLRVGLLDDMQARGEEMVELMHWPVELPGIAGPVIVGPAKGRIVYVADNGVASELRVAQVTGEVGRAVASFPEVIWTMAIDPAGEAAYVVLLARERGEDRGVWRVLLSGDGPPVQVLPPSPRSVATKGDRGIRLVAVIRFVRELQVSADGRLVVRRACGEPFGSCDLDVVSLIDGRVQHVGETDVSELLGVTDGLVIGGTDEECPTAGNCQLIRTALDLRTGLMIPVAPTDGRDRVSVGDAGQGLHIWMEDAPGQPAHYLLRVTDLRTGVSWAATQPLAELWYQPPFPGVVGVEMPHGWILVSTTVPTAVHLQAGATLPLELPEPKPIDAFNS